MDEEERRNNKETEKKESIVEGLVGGGNEKGNFPMWRQRGKKGSVEKEVKMEAEEEEEEGTKPSDSVIIF